MSSFCLSSAEVVPAAWCGVQGSRACKEQITRCAWGTSLPCWVMPGVRSKLFLPYPSRMHLLLWYGAHGLCSGSESARRCSSPHPELFRGSAHVLRWPSNGRRRLLVCFSLLSVLQPFIRWASKRHSGVWTHSLSECIFPFIAPRGLIWCFVDDCLEVWLRLHWVNRPGGEKRNGDFKQKTLP